METGLDEVHTSLAAAMERLNGPVLEEVLVNQQQTMDTTIRVMERVMRGEDSTEIHRKKNGRRRSVVAQEEEVRRLKSIVSTNVIFAASRYLGIVLT